MRTAARTTSACVSVSVLSASVTSTPLPTAIGVFGMVHWICAALKSAPNQVSVFVKIPARRDGYDEFVFVGQSRR